MDLDYSAYCLKIIEKSLILGTFEIILENVNKQMTFVIIR